MKQPWEMTSNEWERAREENRPEYFGSSTKHGGAEAAARLERLEFLLDGVEVPFDPTFGFGGPRPVRHQDVVASAVARGCPVPAEVLAEYDGVLL